MRPFVPSRVDRNQADIVRDFRRLGYTVACTHATGHGFPDLVVAKWGITVLVEVKDGSLPPSARQFKKTQRLFNFTWAGMLCVATCTEDVLSIDRQIQALANQVRAARIALKVQGCADPIYRLSLA